MSSSITSRVLSPQDRAQNKLRTEKETRQTNCPQPHPGLEGGIRKHSTEPLADIDSITQRELKRHRKNTGGVI